MDSGKISFGHSFTLLNRYDVEFFFPIPKKYEIEKFIALFLFSVVFVCTAELCEIVIERIW